MTPRGGAMCHAQSCSPCSQAVRNRKTYWDWCFSPLAGACAEEDDVGCDGTNQEPSPEMASFPPLQETPVLQEMYMMLRHGGMRSLFVGGMVTIMRAQGVPSRQGVSESPGFLTIWMLPPDNPRQ